MEFNLTRLNHQQNAIHLLFFKSRQPSKAGSLALPFSELTQYSHCFSGLSSKRMLQTFPYVGRAEMPRSFTLGRVADAEKPPART